MAYTDKYGTFFGRLDADGNVVVLHVEDGAPATRLDQNIYPVGSDGSKSVQYDHPGGIVLNAQDAERLGLEIE